MFFKKAAVAAFSAGATLALVVAPVGAQDSVSYSGTFGELNDSGASGTFTMEVAGTSAVVEVTMMGMVDLVHAQHIHGVVGTANSCPDISLDTDGDGLISTVEGVPSYGAVLVSLTTEGDTGPDSSLAIERFPVAAGGTYTYTQTIELAADVAGGLDDFLVIVHGVDLDGSGEYDGDAKSKLDAALPLEATLPAACGKVVAAAAAPSGGVATGAGGTADSTSSGAAGLALVAAGGAAALLFSRQRRRLA